MNKLSQSSKLVDDFWNWTLQQSIVWNVLYPTTTGVPKEENNEHHLPYQNDYLCFNNCNTE